MSQTFSVGYQDLFVNFTSDISLAASMFQCIGFFLFNLLPVLKIMSFVSIDAMFISQVVFV